MAFSGTASGDAVGATTVGTGAPVGIEPRRVSWGAILTGVVVALAAQVLLAMLGAGIGLASLEPTQVGDNPAASGMGIGAAVWWALSGILAAGAGGWVAARLAGVPSRQIGLLHGLAVWAVATLVVLYLLSSTATALVGGAFNVVGRTLSGVGGAAGSAASSVAEQFGNPLQALQDEIRGAAGPNTDPAAAGRQLAAAMGRVLTSEGDAANQARQSAVEVLTRQGVAPDEAQRRVQAWEQRYRETRDQAAAQAREAADAAADGASTAAFYGFVALLLGAIAGALAGRAGAPGAGRRRHHGPRDQGVQRRLSKPGAAARCRGVPGAGQRCRPRKGQERCSTPTISSAASCRAVARAATRRAGSSTPWASAASAAQVARSGRSWAGSAAGRTASATRVVPAAASWAASPACSAAGAAAALVVPWVVAWAVAGRGPRPDDRRLGRPCRLGPLGPGPRQHGRRSRRGNGWPRRRQHARRGRRRRLGAARHAGDERAAQPPAAAAASAPAGGVPAAGMGAAYAGGTDPDQDAMPPEQTVSDQTAKLVLRAMIDAAKADGRVDTAERQRIVAKVQEGGADPEAAAFLQQELERPADPDGLAAEARDPVVAARPRTPWSSTSTCRASPGTALRSRSSSGC